MSINTPTTNQQTPPQSLHERIEELQLFTVMISRCIETDLFRDDQVHQRLETLGRIAAKI